MLKEHYSYEHDYIKSDLGGYGLYYRAVMADFGNIYPSGPGIPIPFEVPTEYGKEVASAFHQGIQEKHYFHNYFDGLYQDIPLDVIQEYLHRARLCQPKTESAPGLFYLMVAFLLCATNDIRSLLIEKRSPSLWMYSAEHAQSRWATVQFFGNGAPKRRSGVG